MAKKISFSIKLKTHDKFLLVGTILCALLWCIVIFVMPNLQPVVPLRYTLPNGDEQLLAKEYLYILPGAGVIINAVTLIFLNLNRDYDAVILKLLAMTAMIFQILILLVTMRIIILVI